MGPSMLGAAPENMPGVHFRRSTGVAMDTPNALGSRRRQGGHDTTGAEKTARFWAVTPADRVFDDLTAEALRVAGVSASSKALD